MANRLADIWDTRHQAPIFRWSDIASVVIGCRGESGLRERHVIARPEPSSTDLTIDSLYSRGVGKTLIVSLHGALVRQSVELPRFEWIAALQERPEHQLFIADSMLFESDSLTLGWYIGNEQVDLTRRLAVYVDHVREQLGVEKVVFLGSSGGGYASLAIATYVAKSTVVCFTPQTDVWKFSDGHTKNLLSESFPSHATVQSVTATDPSRFSLVERYKNPSRKNRFIYIQNTGDVGHLRDHFKPFAESLGVRLPNGRTFDQSGRFISFDYGDGHVAPPKHRLGEFLDLAIAELDLERKAPVLSAGEHGQLASSKFNPGENIFVRVPPELNSYYLADNPPLRYAAPGLAFDANGVPLRVIGEIEYDHPVLQAQYLLKQLNTLRSSGDLEVEAVARAIVDRWIDVAVKSRAASFLPYGFEWNAGKQQPPWYSAMAQGQALSAVARLYEFFPEEKFRDFAESLFQSFELLPDVDDPMLPWVVDIDSEGYLWLEEYPNPGQGKCVINGHLFAVWGLYDYWRVFGHDRARHLASAALETTKHYILKSRNPGWASHYDLNSFFLIRNYHQTHISQLETTFNITDNPFFLYAADLLEADFPSYQRSGSAYLAKGDHNLHRMDNTNVPTKSVESRLFTLEEATAFDFEVRTKAEECDGIWLRLSSGHLSGWWAREQPPLVFPRLCFDKHYYGRPRRILLPAGDVEHNSFNKWGSVVDRQVVVLSEAKEVLVRCRALWNGIAFYQIDPSSDSAALPANRWLRVEDC